MGRRPSRGIAYVAPVCGEAPKLSPPTRVTSSSSVMAFWNSLARASGDSARSHHGCADRVGQGAGAAATWALAAVALPEVVVATPTRVVAARASDVVRVVRRRRPGAVTCVQRRLRDAGYV